MSIVESGSSFVGTALGYALPFLFVLTLVVFIHELGHFLVARLFGVRVEAFSLGFGPEIVGFRDRHDTRWRIAAIPLGGYVKFLGDENAAGVPDGQALRRLTPEERRFSFAGQSVARRAAIVAAGPAANFVLAIALFAGIFAVHGRVQIEPIVDQLQAGGAAERAGIKVGDRIVAIDGDAIESFSDMQRIVSASPGEDLVVDLDRGGERLAVNATPELREVSDGFGGKHRIGVLGISRSTDPQNQKLERYGVLRSLGMGVKETWFVVERTGSFVAGLFLGKESADQLGGPLRIAEVSGKVATVGFAALLDLTAVLSVSIGLLNLVPIPLLDGGHLLFYGIEAARGRPLSDRAQEFGMRIGLALVVMLMLFATWNDIVHLSSLG